MTYIQRNKSSSGDASRSILYRDRVIGTDTVGMIDLSNQWCYDQADPTVVNGAVRELVRGAPVAEFRSSAPFSGHGVALGAGEMLRLGDNWRLPSTAKHYGFVLWAAIQRTGYDTAAAGLGYGMTAGFWSADAGAQYMIGIVLDRGTAVHVRLLADNAAVDIPAISYATGNPRQYGLEVKISGSTKVLTAYVDGEIAGEKTASFDGALPVPDANSAHPMIGKAVGWTYPTIGKAYGASLHNLSGGRRSFNDILAADIAARADRFS